MSYQEERKFITYLTNINLRALLMSDGISNDLRGSVEQHSQNHSPHQSFHISPTHTCYLIYRGLARQLEGDMGLKGIQANVVYLILIYPGWFSAYH